MMEIRAKNLRCIWTFCLRITTRTQKLNSAVEDLLLARTRLTCVINLQISLAVWATQQRFAKQSKTMWSKLKSSIRRKPGESTRQMTRLAVPRRQLEATMSDRGELTVRWALSCKWWWPTQSWPSSTVSSSTQSATRHYSCRLCTTQMTIAWSFC